MYVVETNSTPYLCLLLYVSPGAQPEVDEEDLVRVGGTGQPEHEVLCRRGWRTREAAVLGFESWLYVCMYFFFYEIARVYVMPQLKITTWRVSASGDERPHFDTGVGTMFCGVHSYY